MDLITEFLKIYKNDNSTYKYGLINHIDELIGPKYNEGLCHFAYTIDNEYIHTVPHIDIFKVEGDNRTIFNKNSFPASNASSAAAFEEKGSDDILLSGTTLDITAKYYGSDIVSLSQYFLENPTRENKIQYLIWWKGQGIAKPFEAFVPGLLMSNNGSVIGFIHSYIANDINKTFIEHPYADGKTYTLSGTGFTSEIKDNGFVLTLSGNLPVNVKISNGSEFAEFIVYPENYSNEEKSYRIKVANEYGDYTVAAQITEHNTIKEVLDLLSETTMDMFNPEIGYAPLPKTFKSLALVKFAESVKNITLNIYKVPIAFVPNGESIVFMTDVTGISANEINRN